MWRFPSDVTDLPQTCLWTKFAGQIGRWGFGLRSDLLRPLMDRGIPLTCACLAPAAGGKLTEFQPPTCLHEFLP
ncbi:MAG TPA: hypothetical protein DCG12_11085 [Planctomycetaceae bacterium]|nr:hypothetical protein [Planctomycetaceae bacterium]